MAKLYLIVVPHDGRLQPTFVNKPAKVKEVVVEVLDFDDALALGPMELDDLLSRMGKSLNTIEERMRGSDADEGSHPRAARDDGPRGGRLL